MIKIKNDSAGAKFYFRINSDGKEPETWFRIEGQKTLEIPRKVGKYQIQLASYANQEHPETYDIECPANLVITSDMFLIFEENNKYLNFSKQPFTSTAQLIPSNTNGNNSDLKGVRVWNSYTSTIWMRLSGEIPEEENWIPIQSNASNFWPRKTGKYLLEYSKKEKEPLGPTVEVGLDDYQLKNNFIVYDSNGTITSFSKIAFHNYIKDKYKNNSDYNNTGGKPGETTIIIDNPDPIQPIKPENFKKLILTNAYSQSIHVRVKAMKTGTEDLIKIDPNCKSIWTREIGKFLLEVIIDKDNRSKFYVNCPANYTFSNQDNLKNDVNQKKIDTTKDNNFSKCKFDEEVTEPSNEIIDQSVPYYKNRVPSYNGVGKYTDNDFPPEPRSINSTDENGCEIYPKYEHTGKYFNTSDIEFKRASEHFGPEFALFKDSINIKDVTQGGLGDCYLIAALSALSLRPDMVQQVFKTKSANKNGFYELYFYEDGQKYLMILDDYFPFKNEEFMFASPNGPELWAILIEKLFAKYEGGYTNIHGGFLEDTLSFLTGAVTTKIRELYSAWDEIYSALAKGHLVCASSLSSEEGSDQTTTSGGIHMNHAYSVVAAKTYRLGEYDELRLIQCRNPWGEGEWHGAWSDKSGCWTPELAEYFNLNEIDKEDGRFWMSFTDFCQNFKYVIFCYV
jgi:hypothetical protein